MYGRQVQMLCSGDWEQSHLGGHLPTTQSWGSGPFAKLIPGSHDTGSYQSR